MCVNTHTGMCVWWIDTYITEEKLPQDGFLASGLSHLLRVHSKNQFPSAPFCGTPKSHEL